jgi:uncharacterized membrane protein YfcA
MIEFPVSGVETYWWLPVVVSFAISSVTSMGGVSGAFFLLPFQMSMLGFTGPAVSSTNMMFNVVAIPSGVYSYHREKRMVWPLAWAITISSLPGIFIGAIIRVKFLPDPKSFKLFVALVLLYLCVRLGSDILRRLQKPEQKPAASDQFEVRSPVMSFRKISYEFNGVSYSLAGWKLTLLCFLVGIIGGTYGIGGGAIIAPFLVAVFRLPVHSVAGACLFGTFVSSIGGVISYAAIAPLFSETNLAITPDWLLGALFGLGGMAGMYVGARLQRFLPARLIKGLLAAAVLSVVIKYVVEFLS